jgi:hypothetical protein
MSERSLCDNIERPQQAGVWLKICDIVRPWNRAAAAQMGSAEMICLIVQDGGLCYHCRTKGFAFATGPKAEGSTTMRRARALLAATGLVVPARASDQHIRAAAVTTAAGG